MNSESLGYEVELAASFDEAIERVTQALAAEGFGIISRVDIDKAFKEKLGKPFRPYTILGACNPALAHTALTTNPEVGLFLPCNVTVEETGVEQSLVRVINAEAMMSAGGLDKNSEIKNVGMDASIRLKSVVAELKK